MRWELDWGGRQLPLFSGDYTPDPGQQAVLDHRTGSLLVIGAAGSGKTRTLVNTVAERIRAGVDPTAILVVTFGKRAVREFREGVAELSESVALPTIGTFHSLAYSLAQSQGLTSVLSGAEEDARITEIIKGLAEDSRLPWPDSLKAAAHTRSFAREIRAVIARLKELHMSGQDLVALGEREGRPEWVVAGLIAANEAEIMNLEGVLDYQSLLVQARENLHQSDALRVITHLYIDEYQELGPLQHDFVQTLSEVANRGQGLIELIVSANPNESIFTFRGATAGIVEKFHSDFPGSGQVTLSTFWRGSEPIGRAAESVYGQPSESGSSRGLAVAYRDFPRGDSITSVPTSAAAAVEIQRYGNRNSRAAFVAQQIRTAHLENEVPWRRMAVIGRATSDIPTITRALARENIPVVVATDELALAEESAVKLLLSILSAAASPESTSVATALDLLTSPICGLDPSDIRRLGRILRQSNKDLSSNQLIRDLVIKGERSDIPESHSGSNRPLDSDLMVRVARLQGLLGQLRREIGEGKSVPDLLWLAWTGGSKFAHGWPERLRAAALRHSAHAHHDIDTVMALFDTAERFSSRGRTGLGNFIYALEQQNLPAEPVASRGLRADAVQVMTVHQSKGQQWERVWITGLEEGIWPNLVVRGSVLHPDEITSEGIGAGANSVALLREERNLFYVAASRASDSVVFTCIDQGNDGGDQPSRFIADLLRVGVPDRVVTGFPRARTTWSGLVAELRSVLADKDSSESLKSAAGSLLATMGPTVAPETWWGISELTRSTRPIRPRDLPLHMSGSSLDELIACPLKWFLDKEVKAQVMRGSATAFGSIVHAVAEFVAKEEVPANLEAMQELINSSWRNLVYESPWQSQSELAEARKAAARFLRYHEQAERVFIEAEGEVATQVTVTTPSGSQEVINLMGFVDRVERDDAGRLVAIDFKNMREPVPNSKIPDHGQLGVYQLLLRDRQGEDLHQVGEAGIGAALVQLRVEDKTGAPKVQGQPAIDFSDQPTWIEERLGEAAEIIRNEAFIPIVGSECRLCSYHSVCPTKSGTIFDTRYEGDSDE